MTAKSNACMFIDIWGRFSEVRRDGLILGKWDPEYYAYKVACDESMIRDEQHVDELVSSLLGKSSIWRNETPEIVGSVFVPWFSVIIGVSDTRKKKSHYVVDYRSWPGAPLNIIDQGMGIYHMVKRNLKRAIKRGQAK